MSFLRAMRYMIEASLYLPFLKYSFPLSTYFFLATSGSRLQATTSRSKETTQRSVPEVLIKWPPTELLQHKTTLATIETFLLVPAKDTGSVLVSPKWSLSSRGMRILFGTVMYVGSIQTGKARLATDERGFNKSSLIRVNSG